MISKGTIVSGRKGCGLTQQEMATELGISRSHYANIESGKRNPSPKLAQKIGAILNLDWKIFFI